MPIHTLTRREFFRLSAFFATNVLLVACSKSSPETPTVPSTATPLPIAPAPTAVWTDTPAPTQTRLPGTAQTIPPRTPTVAGAIPYLHPPVREPFPDGVNQTIPSELRDQRFAALGILDVTQPPFNADPTGRNDSTYALQRAIEFARDAQMVCFFPPGTFRISDTLACTQLRYQRTNGVILQAQFFPCLLIGSRAGLTRPQIVLIPDAPGFGDPNKLKPVIHFWARGYQNPTQKLSDALSPEVEQPNISMNQMFVNIDVTVGARNHGAIAIRHQAAEGSAIEDCTIDATHGFIGIQGGIGSGGGSAGVQVIGGRIGLDFTGYLSGTQPTPTITAFTLVGQTQTAIRSTSRQALVAVGLKIVASESAGPLIECLPAASSPNNGQLSLVDSEIVFEGAAAAMSKRVAISSNRSVYLNNVYVRGATQIDDDPEGGDSLAGNPAGWQHVREYARAGKSREDQGMRYSYPIYLDGIRVKDSFADVRANQSPPPDLQTRHWQAENFPSWESSGAINVKTSPYRAQGDGKADDTAALQRAINENEIVFLPKGYYRITRVLELKSNTKLIGVGQHLSVLVATQAGGDFADAANPAPLVRTADVAKADTSIAFCGLWAAWDVPSAYALHWRCGGNSIFRAVEINELPIRGFTPRPRGEPPPPLKEHPLVVVSGNGGGRWYNWRAEAGHNQGKNYRHLLITNNANPLSIYQFSPQHVTSTVAVELRGAQRISVFGAKYEGNQPMLWICDSDEIRVFGHGGNGKGLEDGCLFLIERTPNFLIANAVDGLTKIGSGEVNTSSGYSTDPRKWHMIIERPAGQSENKLPPLERPALYRRGAS